MHRLERLFEHNRGWVVGKRENDPDYFRSRAAQQTPQFLWIGCSDSRVMANEITGLDAGELFVHRNIANIVVHTDFNCLSVLEFGIDSLGVRDIIVCGHYNCGGIAAAMKPPGIGIANNWLQHVRDIAADNAAELAPLAADPDAYANRLAELNVRRQVRNIASSAVVREAWARGDDLHIHGLIYSLADGLLHDLGCGFAPPD